MTLKKKILLGNGVALFLMFAVIIWAIVNLISLGKATDEILSENYRSILAAENMVDALERLDSAILLVLLGDRERGNSQFRNNDAVFIEWLSRAKDNITIHGEAELVQLIASQYSDFRGLFAQTEFNKINVDYYHEKIFPQFAKIREKCVDLRTINEKTMYYASNRAGNVASHAIWTTSIVGLSALLIAILFSVILAERIVKPIHIFMEASRKISSGDYVVRVTTETGDELESLAEEFNLMASRLHRYNEMNIEQIISEKNKGEAILSSIEDALIVFNDSLLVTAINPSARNILKITFSEPLSMHCRDLLPNSDICDVIHKTVETGIQVDIPAEQSIVTFSDYGQTRHYLFSVTIIRGRDRKLSGIVLLLRDISKMREVERLKSEFILAASHELRTPLTSLGMSVDLLLERVADTLSERDRGLLVTAHEETRRMKSLVNDLLDLSKMEAGKIEMEFDNVTIDSLFEKVKSVFKSQAEMKEINIITDNTDDLPQVRADANKIAWVLSNLISNALRYVRRQGYIRLIAQKISLNVHITVLDNGIGIPAEFQTRIFEKFAQVRGQESGGSGLGLAICREIIRAHGGSIWVESTPGKGSSFTFVLPVA
ncbi:MAG: HAMP domain-containing protein [Candidatus Riflebacteria bacterium]|nr:HAMP domain-containing protein [Candidatus Riflebacteria bacterium]